MRCTTRQVLRKWEKIVKLLDSLPGGNSLPMDFGRLECHRIATDRCDSLARLIKKESDAKQTNLT